MQKLSKRRARRAQANPCGRIEHKNQLELCLIDKQGHHHSEAVFKNWSETAIKVLGIRYIDGAKR